MPYMQNHIEINSQESPSGLYLQHSVDLINKYVFISLYIRGGILMVCLWSWG